MPPAVRRIDELPAASRERIRLADWCATEGNFDVDDQPAVGRIHRADVSAVVSQRTREIGIRMALGAQADRVRRLVVARGAAIAPVGVAIGLVGAFSITRVLAGLLFGVEALDAINLVAMSMVMLGLALAASYGPARRASAVDPMVALRAE